MKSLVLAEKPSVGRDIAKVLNCKDKGNGYFEGPKYIVTWALGHLVTLADPESYGEQYKSWSFETLPMLPKKMELTVIKKTSKQFYAIKGLMNRKDVSELIIATDAGREGELVARWIIEKAQCNKPIKRLWISSQTDRAILEGFNGLKDGAQYYNLYKSAICRAEADWIVGLNVTRALTCKYNAQLSAGRVQTPTLAMVVQREEEIKNFVPRDYWNIEAKINNIDFRWQDSEGQNRTFSKEKADTVINKIKNHGGEVLDIKKENKKIQPPQAYDLTELQRDANNKFGFGAKKTLSLIQRLYESHKLVTYPRTDSKYISDDIVATIPERLKSIGVGPYRNLAKSILNGKININKRFVDNSKVTDHHAIIPTEQSVYLDELSIDERKIYDLIVRRFLAVLSPNLEYEQTTIKINIHGEVFYTKVKVVKSKGWKRAYDEDDMEDDKEYTKDQNLLKLKKGDVLKVQSVMGIKGQTNPPSRYTEATLLTDMEDPKKFIKDPSLKKTLDHTGGIGTVATRADIIEKLYNTFYIENKGNEIFPTSKGKQLIELVPQDLKSPEMTGMWEQQLSQISGGKGNDKKFISDIREYAKELVETVKDSDDAYKHDNLTRQKCPECGKYLLEVKGKKGKLLVCQDRQCGYKKGVSQLSNARCPECHKRMEIKGEGEGKIFVCICGYREKLSSYNQRKKEKKNNISKKDVNKYLKNQNGDESINSALAEALSKWKNQ